MVSFQEEGEGTVAAVWFRAAHNAGGTKEKMAAYKKAISTIKVCDVAVVSSFWCAIYVYI